MRARPHEAEAALCAGGNVSTLFVCKGGPRQEQRENKGEDDTGHRVEATIAYVVKQPVSPLMTPHD
ncbi:hypothetical protein AA101099_0611 [Neoasaia chiangmaiensis NBRC 101099]|nr:hypothetical protein AA101099_0611 [Neoasaia chiangmaiensis NBRC 101099]GEN16493.1 hypothetical protein NCH01_29240 [Neoasaia chiangmaiensis]